MVISRGIRYSVAEIVDVVFWGRGSRFGCCASIDGGRGGVSLEPKTEQPQAMDCVISREPGHQEEWGRETVVICTTCTP